MGAFGEWCKTTRADRRLTLKELEAASGVSYGAISDWERGRRTPTRSNAVRIAEALGADPAEALAALMRDTPGLEDSSEIERVPDEEYLLEGIAAYTGDNPILLSAQSFQRALQKAREAGEVTGDEPEEELAYGRGPRKRVR